MHCNTPLLNRAFQLAPKLKYTVIEAAAVDIDNAVFIYKIVIRSHYVFWNVGNSKGEEIQRLGCEPNELRHRHSLCLKESSTSTTSYYLHY